MRPIKMIKSGQSSINFASRLKKLAMPLVHSNGEVEGPRTAARLEPRVHTLFQHPRRHYRSSRTLQRLLGPVMTTVTLHELPEDTRQFLRAHEIVVRRAAE